MLFLNQSLARGILLYLTLTGKDSSSRTREGPIFPDGAGPPDIREGLLG